MTVDSALSKQSSKGKPLPFPDIGTLHERHYGLTVEVAACYAQAVSVSLDRHHDPPGTITVSWNGSSSVPYILNWTPPVDRELAAWKNDDDATRDGAYGLALGAVEVQVGFVALARAQRRSGADYYVGAPGSHVNATDGELDLEEAHLLEISGIAKCETHAQLSKRMRQKVRQVQRGSPDTPALVAVVAFNLPSVALCDA